MSDEGVCRIAPATPGLLKTSVVETLHRYRLPLPVQCLVRHLDALQFWASQDLPAKPIYGALYFRR